MIVSTTSACENRTRREFRLLRVCFKTGITAAGESIAFSGDRHIGTLFINSVSAFWCVLLVFISCWTDRVYDYAMMGVDYLTSLPRGGIVNRVMNYFGETTKRDFH